MENMQTPEGKLIGDAQKRLHISARKAAESLGMSDTRWRNIVNGYQAIGRGDQIKVVAPAETLARMASVVEVTPEELIAVGREDAAAELTAYRGRSLRPEVKDNRAELAKLIREELEESRRGPSEIVKGWSEGATRSFYGWKDGDTVPLRRSRAMLEDALGWRRGVVTDIIEAPITKAFTLSEVRDWAQMPEPGLAKARDLSDAELLAELTRRLGNLRAQVDDSEASDPVGTRNMYDFAANNTAAGRNMEHLEDEDDRG
jgi:transcriptional regulator with XRE-family HTH domain